MKGALLLLVALLGCCVYASYVKDWVRLNKADNTETITFYVALKQRNVDKLEVFYISLSYFVTLFVFTLKCIVCWWALLFSLRFL